MEIKPVRTQRDYTAALKAIAQLMNSKRNTPEGDRLDVLVTLVEAFEAKHYALSDSDQALPTSHSAQVHQAD